MVMARLKRLVTLIYITAISLAAVVPGLIARPAEAALPTDLERTELVTGLNQPTAFRFLPDGRILITEKTGAIKVYANGQVQPQPVITLAVLQTDQDEERGLLGIEPDPDFATNGYLYVSYTSAANHDRLSRITVTGNTADPASEVVLLESDQLGNIYHHGGEVRFGPDGKLYWAMGMNTYNPNSQNLSNVHGKILRLNKDGSAPADNPFVTMPNTIGQIWAYGLRNPFRFNFMPNGKLLAGDVGGDAWEELNDVQKGGNYGWPNAEGTCTGCPYINPIYTYAHTPAPAKAGSITSVMAYTGTTLPTQYRNKVFIADYTLGFIKYLTLDSDYSTFISEQTFDSNAGTVVQLDQGPDGNIYQLNIYPGVLSKIAPSGGNRTPTANASADKIAGLAPLTVNFSSAGSTDPDGQTLSYKWDFGDGTTATAANPSKTYTANGIYNATLTVSDGSKAATATVKITVGNRLPTATITSPANNAKYNAGDTINFSGTGTDPEDGTIPGTAYSWKIDFHHADHIHPFRSGISGSSGSFTIPTSPDNVSTTWYRIYLTVTDSAGLADTKYIDIKPNLASVTVSANYPDAQFTVDGVPKTGTYTEQGVVGVQHVLAAPSPQYVTGAQYIYKAWSDGGAQSHTYTVPAATATVSVAYDKATQPPAPWATKDIGSPTVAGYTSYNTGTFTLRGAGGDIWGPTDEFHYAYQPFRGDGEIVARITSQTNTDGWAKAGIMLKDSATKGAPYVLLGATPANGLTFQYNFTGDGGSTPYTFPNAWVKLKRAGNIVSAYKSVDGSTWTQVGQTTLTMGSEITAGLFVCSHKYDTLGTAVFDNVSVTSAQPAWKNQDVGNPKLTGSTASAGGTWTLKGAGDDIWGTADQFQYNYQPLVGDGQVTARVTSLTSDSSDWAKAGVMIKQSTAAGSPYILAAATPLHGLNTQHSFNTNIAGPGYSFPNAWVRLKRVGNTFTSYSSPDGTTWTVMGTATITIPSTATAGLFVTSHNGSKLATATFDNVTISQAPPPSGLPSPWTDGDVGNPKLAGSASYTNGTFTLNGAGDDIWNTTDQFHYVSQPISGDGEIVTRVTSQDNDTDGWAKSGIMIKESTTAGSPYALLAVTPAHGLTFQANFNTETAGGSYTLPNAWLKLKRVGNVITASKSTNGSTWTTIGSATVPMSATATMGLFVCSHNGSLLNTTIFDNVSTLP